MPQVNPASPTQPGNQRSQPAGSQPAQSSRATGYYDPGLTQNSVANIALSVFKKTGYPSPAAGAYYADPSNQQTHQQPLSSDGLRQMTQGETHHVRREGNPRDCGDYAAMKAPAASRDLAAQVAGYKETLNEVKSHLKAQGCPTMALHAEAVKYIHENNYRGYGHQADPARAHLGK